ncbi:hypothetical protein [Oryza sativa Japonica Group]|uniref:Uncharacterized protein n=1 Tax=Oryza sativa subsp. japonica TaxID=39947 RepID=Q5NBG7_ORYSJ|nr:hypothetical protein [Oryza sativa Japonica Group]BAD81189.1 hypothetical protein [Oryza sativa Japonica Group]
MDIGVGRQGLWTSHQIRAVAETRGSGCETGAGENRGLAMPCVTYRGSGGLIASQLRNNDATTWNHALDESGEK